MPMSMFGLGTVLLIASVTGRYALAGIVAGAGSVGYALCAPQAARLADRLGQQRVLRPLTAFFAVSTMALIICAEFRAPLWTMLVSGALAGASMPSLGSMVRARWSALLGDSPLLHTAFSLESVLDEAIFVIGPAVVTLLATEVTPAAGVAVAMTACVIGTLLFAAQYRTEPLAGPASAPQRAGVSEPEGRGAAWTEERGTSDEGRRCLKGVPEASGGHRSRIPAPGLVTLAPVYFCLGAMFGTIDLSTVDFCVSRGHKPLAGFVLGAYALGSAVGGLCYGSRTWRAPVHRRFALTLCTVAAGTATFCAAGTRRADRGHLLLRPGDLADVHRRVQSDRAAGPGRAADRGHGVAHVGDLGRRGGGIGRRRARHRRRWGPLGLCTRRGMRSGGLGGLSAGAASAAPAQTGTMGRWARVTGRRPGSASRGARRRLD